MSIRSVLNASKRVEIEPQRLLTISRPITKITNCSGQLIIGRRSVLSIIQAKLLTRTADTVTR